MPHEKIKHKKILLGITGGIAAYKTPDLIRQLLNANFDVKVVVTKSATEFVSVLTLKTLLPNRVYELLLEPEMQHIQLAKWADMILIASATANIIAKLAAGFADDLLSTLCLATTAPIVIAPAMNKIMWEHSATQQNIEKLKSHGMIFLGPESGEQACGDIGPGRMMEPDKIIHHLISLDQEPFLKNIRILITAGATREYIDPVRFISNKSSGKMGYALANVAHHLGATVTVIAGHTNQPVPTCQKLICVETAQEMQHAVLNHVSENDIFISVAAVSDYTIKKSFQKIKRSVESLTLTLTPTSDILALVCAQKEKPFTVGFAAETDNVIENAKTKRIKKGVNIIVANDVSQSDIGFESDDNAVTVITKDEMVVLEKTSKERVAIKILEIIKKQFRQACA